MARPRNTTPVEDRKVLTINEVMQLAKKLGRSVSRAVIGKAIDTGRLKASIDELRHDPFGRPVIVIERRDLDAWLAQTLHPYSPGLRSAV